MALKKCSGCNVLFDASENKDYCSNCSMELFNSYSEDKQEEIYYKVREYLLNHPGTAKTTLASMMDISIKVIDKWIREGKIEEIEGVMASGVVKKQFICTSCGKKIDGGILCSHCKKAYETNNSNEQAVVGFRSNIAK